jgi:pyrroloquinoline quinone (PQQ) biosynthesis protein C
MQTPEETAALVSRALVGRRLLDHPFYRRWERGALQDGELARYAEQYVHVERCLPEVLEAIARRLPPGRARSRVEATLAEELGDPDAHVDLFAAFGRAVGAGEVPPTPAAADLVALHRSSAERDPHEALAVLAAYETQAAEIAWSKADGLRRHYGLGPADTAFWDLHAVREGDHARWTLEALGDADDGGLQSACRSAADAWWTFLDEREEHGRLIAAGT